MMRRKRVLFLDPRLSSVAGGGETLTLRKIQALDPAHFQVTVVSRSELHSRLFQEFLSDRPGLEFISVDCSGQTRAAMARALRERGHPEWILDDPFVFDAIRFSLAAGPLLRTITCDLISVSSLPDLLCVDLPCRRVLHVYGLPPPDQVPSQMTTLATVHGFSAVSRHVSDGFARLFAGAVRTQQIRLVSPCLTPRFSVRPSDAPRDIDFIFVGRLRKRKGVDLIVEALGILGQYGQALPSVFIVGDGPHRETLESRASALRLRSNVTFYGEADTSEVIALLDRSRWFLFPVRLPEAFGLAPLEAMARGSVPIVGVLGGMSEYLVNGQNGTVLSAVDESALASAMRQALADETRRLSHAESGRQTANRYSWDGFTERVNSFFQDAIR